MSYDDLEEIIEENKEEIVRDYVAYRRSFRRNHPGKKSKMRFERYAYDWARETAQDARDYAAHIRSESAQWRFA